MAEGGHGDELRIVVIGKTGAGKSATCNTIVGGKKFTSRPSSNSVTEDIQWEQADIAGRHVMVVDTPGFFDTKLDAEKVACIIVRSLITTAPGPHAFLYVVPVNVRFTEEDSRVYTRITDTFGKAVNSYLVLVLTHGDKFNEEFTLESYKEKAPKTLKLVFEKCADRVIVFNNKKPTNEARELIEMIQNLGLVCFQEGTYQQATKKAIDGEIQRRLRVSEKKELKDNPYVQQLEKDAEELEKIKKEVATGRMTGFVLGIVGAVAGGAVAALAAPAAVPVAVGATAVCGAVGHIVGEKLSKVKKENPKDKDA